MEGPNKGRAYINMHGKKKASSGKAAKKNGAAKKPKEDLGASEHKKMLQQPRL